ncbi:MAG TPA: response regulator, partial [Kofleriaceae bacterium]|nr:response regulator [Kofleriaceae bacterium]
MAGEPVLVVDDYPINLKLMRLLLLDEEYDVHTVHDAEQALEIVEAVRPRVILTDVRLPGMDGLELTRRLKADPTTRDIPVVAVTAQAREGDEELALAAGCDGYLPKPIDVDALTELVARCTGRITV